MSNLATLSPAELRALGFEAKDGRAVKIAPPKEPPASERAWPVMQFELPRPRSLLRETPEQGEVCKVFLTAGCKPRSTSQFRKSKTALGIPDIWVFPPAGRFEAFWFETKSGADWKFSTDQLTWALDCYASNTLYGCGDRWSALALLDALKIPRRRDA